MSTIAKFEVRNPSSWVRPDWRFHEHVEIRYNEAPGIFEGDDVFLVEKNPVIFQIDRPDPNRTSEDIFVFKPGGVNPGSDDYSTPSGSIYEIIKGNSITRENPSINIVGFAKNEPSTEIPIDSSAYDSLLGLKFSNRDLKAYLSLGQNEGYYSGSVTSVELDRKPLHMRGPWCKEFLDFWKWSCEGHSPKKQFGKVETLFIPAPVWHSGDYVNVDTASLKFKVISHNIGPLRGMISLKSGPFVIPYPANWSSTEALDLECNLHRIITFYPEGSYFIEDCFLVACEPQTRRTFLLPFSPQYKWWMDLGEPTEVTRHDQVAHWLAVSNPLAAPFPVLALATNAPSTDFWRPDEYTYCWKLGTQKRLRIIQHFGLGDEFERGKNVGDLIGHEWYLGILKPLRACRLLEREGHA